MNNLNCEQVKDYNLPIFINTPLFVLQDKKLDFIDKFIFSFLWSLAVAGRKINVSDDYIATMLGISNRYVREKIRYLESIFYIKRIRKGRRFIEVLRFENDKIAYDETDNNTIGTTVPISTDIKQIGTTVPIEQEPQFLLNRNHSSSYNKEDIKEDIKNTTTSSSSNFLEDYKEKERLNLEQINNQYSNQKTAQKFREEALSDLKCLEVFKQRFNNIPVTIEELYDDCLDYWSQKGQMVYKARFLTHLKKAPIDTYKDFDKIKSKSSITPDELQLIQNYCSLCKGNRIPDHQTKQEISILIERLKKTDSAQAREALSAIFKAEEIAASGNFMKIVKQASTHEQKRQCSEETKKQLALLKGILK